MPLYSMVKWCLLPIRVESSVYNRLVQIAPDGDVSELLKQTVERLTLLTEPAERDIRY